MVVFIQFLLAVALCWWCALQPPLRAGQVHVAVLLVWLVQAGWFLRRGRKRPHTLFSLAVGMMPLAVSTSVMRWGFAQGPGWGAALLVLGGAAALAVGLYVVQAAAAAAFGLARMKEDEAAMPDPRAAAPGAPVPAAGWIVHPSGLRYQTTYTGEIGMGGPATHCHTFDNGAELGDGALAISADGRYAACTGVRSPSAITLMDFATGRSVSWSDRADAELLGEDDGAAHPQLLRRLGSADAVQWRKVHGLWVAPDCELAPETVERDAPGGRHRLVFRASIDEPALRERPDGVAYLRCPDYAVHLDGVPLPVRVRHPEKTVWSAAGDVLLLAAEAGLDGNTHWLWREEVEPCWVRADCAARVALDSAVVGAVLEVDREGLVLALSVGVASGGGYPQRWLGLSSPSSFTHSRSEEWIHGADAFGRLDVVRVAGAEQEWRVRLSWFELATYAPGRVETRRGAGCPPAVFEPMPGQEAAKRPAFRVRSGAAEAENVRLLHLWSDCGRYLVLSPHALGAADGFFVLDVRTGQRIDTGFRAPGLQLHRYEEGLLQVQAPVGSVPRGYAFGAFEAIAPAPLPDREGCTRAADERWLLLESLRFQVVSTGVLSGPLEKCVRLERPPYPNAAFPFVLPSPDGRRWVHCFGARGEFNDGYAREQESRYQACVVTESGVCIEGLGTAMIWSEDSRFLFFTCRSAPESPGYRDTDWRGRVLDCEAQQLSAEIPLGGLAILDRFDREGLVYRRVEADWWREDLETEPCRLPRERLGALAFSPLRAAGDCWLPAGAPVRPEWVAQLAVSRKLVRGLGIAATG